MKVCSHCRSPLKVLFRDFEDIIGFNFHWVGDLYCVDAVFVLENVVFGLFRVMYVVGK